MSCPECRYGNCYSCADQNRVQHGEPVCCCGLLSLEDFHSLQAEDDADDWADMSWHDGCAS